MQNQESNKNQENHRQNREDHPALNINFGRIMAKATALALTIVITTVAIIFLIMQLLSN